MANPIGTPPANFVGTSTNPAAPVLTADAVNTAFSECEWLANKDAAGGYIGKNTDGSVLVGTLHGNGNIGGALPSLTGQTYIVSYNYDSGSEGDVDLFNTYYPNYTGSQQAFCFFKYTSTNSVVRVGAINNQGIYTGNGAQFSGNVSAGTCSVSGISTFGDKTSVNGGSGSHTGAGTYNLGVNASSGTDAVFCLNISGQTATYLSLKTSTGLLSIGGYAWPADVWQISSAGDTVQTGRVTAATLTLTGLPTSPGAAGSGVVWNNNGVLSIS